jgi:hypothetical protein
MGRSAFGVFIAFSIAAPSNPGASMSTFDYKNYCVTVDADVGRFFPGQAGAVRGIFAIWEPGEGERKRQVYRGHTTHTFPATEVDRIVAASEEAARAWIDTNAGKPWA